MQSIYNTITNDGVTEEYKAPPPSQKRKLQLQLQDVYQTGISNFLTVQEKIAHENINRGFHQFFKNKKTRAEKAAYLVLIGRPKELLRVLMQDMDAFFIRTPQVKDAAERVFYNVSAADLILFLKEEDMLNQVYELARCLPEDTKEQRTQKIQFFSQWKALFASHGLGGADLVMVYDDTPPQYASIKANRLYNFPVYTQTLANETWVTEKTVLKNPDGIVCWKTTTDQLLWYYANPLTETLDIIAIAYPLSEEEQAEYDALVKSMLQMPPYAARRSSNQEYRLILRIMSNIKTKEPIELVRNGIEYQQDGIDYIDTHHDFNQLLNAYLKAILLFYNYHHHHQEQDKDAGYLILKEKIGPLQRYAMWIIQRICQRHLLFRSLPLDYKNTLFERSTVVRDHVKTGEVLNLFDAKSGKFLPYFADNSCKQLHTYSFLFKGDPLHTGYAILGSGATLALVFEFISLNTLIEDAIKGIDAFSNIIDKEIQNLETLNLAMELSEKQTQCGG